MTTVALGDVCEVTTGQPAPQDVAAFGSRGVPFVRAGSLERLCAGESEDSLERVEPAKARQFRLKTYPANTVVFPKSGMSAKVGRVYRLRKDCHLVSHLAAVLPSERVDSSYLHRWLEYSPPSRLIENDAYPSIKTSTLEKIRIPLPSLPEQRRIAATLDKADALRAKRREAIAKLDQLSRSVFFDMFGDPATNPKSWSMEEVSIHASKIGSGATPRGGSSAYKAEGVSLIRSMNVHDGRFRHKNLARIDEDQARKLGNVVVSEDDVLLNITGASVARVCRAPSEVLPARVNQHVAIIRCNPTLSPVYLERLLLAMKETLLGVAGGGATREAITKQQIESLRVPIPPMDLQGRFAHIVRSIQTERTKMLRAMRESDRLFASLQYRAFSGTL